MEELLSQIETGVTNGTHYLALMGALALPDICAGLEAGDGLSTGRRYRDWYSDNAAARFPLLDSEDCYGLRCSMLHQGRLGHPKGQFARIVFVEPGASANVFHMNVLNNALNIDVGVFCRDMVAAARAWLTSTRGTEPFDTNIDLFVRRYQDGLAPYIVGVPVIS